MVGIALKSKHLHVGPECLSADLIEYPAQILEEFRSTVGGSFAYAYFVLPCEDIGVDFLDLAAEVVICFKYTCAVWSDAGGADGRAVLPVYYDWGPQTVAGRCVAAAFPKRCDRPGIAGFGIGRFAEFIV